MRLSPMVGPRLSELAANKVAVPSDATRTQCMACGEFVVFLPTEVTVLQAGKHGPCCIACVRTASRYFKHFDKVCGDV